MPATGLRRHVTSPDPGATTALGASLADVARAGDVLCLWGDLGAGKTHLAKAFGPRSAFARRSRRRASS